MIQKQLSIVREEEEDERLGRHNDEASGIEATDSGGCGADEHAKHKGSPINQSEPICCSSMENQNEQPAESSPNTDTKLALESDRTNWDAYKENIQPIPQGRKIEALFQSLPLIDDNAKRQQLYDIRKGTFDKQLETLCDNLDKQLDLWCEFIDWLEQNVPDGGKVNKITNALEQCIEFYYDKKEFKQDQRLFNIFMKFKRFCDEPVEVYGFMYTNSISTLLATFYLNWSWQYECRKNMKRAEDLIKLGIKNLATPREVLVEAELQLKCRIARLVRDGALDEYLAGQSGGFSLQNQAELTNSGIRAALQTLKCRKTKSNGLKAPVRRIGSSVVEDRANVGGLKSQTKVVNGVRVPTNRKGTASAKPSRTSNKPIFVFNEQLSGNPGQQDQGPTRVRCTGVAGQESGAPTNGDEHFPSANRVASDNSTSNATSGAPLSTIMLKMPTSQSIQSVGRSGAENQVPRSGLIANNKRPAAEARAVLGRRF